MSQIGVECRAFSIMVSMRSSLGHDECCIGRFSAWSDNLGEGECGYMRVVVCRVLCDVENDEVVEEWLWDEGQRHYPPIPMHRVCYVLDVVLP